MTFATADAAMSSEGTYIVSIPPKSAITSRVSKVSSLYLYNIILKKSSL